jgi:hypothetical protein
VLLRQSKRPRVAIPSVLIVLLLAGLVIWWTDRSLKARWARTEGLLEIAQLIEHEKLGDAYALAIQADKYISGNPLLQPVCGDGSICSGVRPGLMNTASITGISRR